MSKKKTKLGQGLLKGLKEVLEMNKSKKLIEAYKEIQDINDKIEPYPWEVWTVFFDKACRPEIVGNVISMGPDTDYQSVEQVKKAIEYMAEQFDGKVKWGKK